MFGIIKNFNSLFTILTQDLKKKAFKKKTTKKKKTSEVCYFPQYPRKQKFS